MLECLIPVATVICDMQVSSVYHRGLSGTNLPVPWGRVAPGPRIKAQMAERCWVTGSCDLTEHHLPFSLSCTSPAPRHIPTAAYLLQYKQRCIQNKWSCHGGCLFYDPGSVRHNYCSARVCVSRLLRLSQQCSSDFSANGDGGPFAISGLPANSVSCICLRHLKFFGRRCKMQHSKSAKRVQLQL